MVNFLTKVPILVLLFCLLHNAKADVQIENATTTVEPATTTAIELETTKAIELIRTTTIEPIVNVMWNLTTPVMNISVENASSTIKPNLTVGASPCSNPTIALFNNVVNAANDRRSLNFFYANAERFDAHLAQKIEEHKQEHAYRNLYIMMKKLLNVLNATMASSMSSNIHAIKETTVATPVTNASHVEMTTTRRNRPAFLTSINVKRPHNAKVDIETDPAEYPISFNMLMKMSKYEWRPWRTNVNQRNDNDDDDDDDDDDDAYRRRQHSNFFYFKRHD